MYPFLSLHSDGTLYAAWVTQQHGRYCYRAIHLMRSRHGGTTWETLTGERLEPPVVADDSGPTDRISGDDELLDHSWLFGCAPIGTSLHCVYSTFPAPHRSGFGPARRINYVRIDLVSGKVVRRFSQSRLGGERVALNKWNGFLARDPANPRCPLYVVAADGERIAALWWADGEEWHDAARATRRFFHCYAIGGCREVTPDGWVLGSFTSVPREDDIFARCAVYFFKLRRQG